MHRGKEVCPHCNGFYRWVPKEKDDTTGKVRPRRASKRLLDLIPEERRQACNLCRRPVRCFPARVVLEAHHMIPRNEGGGDTPDNLLALCSDCHKDAHHKERIFRAYWDPTFAVTEADANHELSLAA
jgi:5-methylcytosine-specific restriction endonuclease McrA